MKYFMMKYFLISGAVCLFACVCPGMPAAAAYVTGADLVKQCESNQSNQIYACMGYVAGIIDYQIMQQSLGTQPSVDFCLPNDLSIEKAAVTVMLYLEKNPMQGSFIAAPAVTMALQQAYPCAPLRPARKHRHND